MQIAFGAGSLYGTQLLDASGNTITNPTPVRFGVLQDCSLDVSFESKMLYGNQQFPIAVGRSKGKISVKAKAAQISAPLMNAIIFGQTVTTGQQLVSIDEGPTAIPTTPFQITVTNSATFVADLGVYNASTGLPMKRVASAPAAGQYSVSVAGVYTFASADQVAGVQVKINYSYTIAASGNKIAVANLLMGYAPSFQAELILPFQGKNLYVKLNNCISSKFSLATKLDDFIIPEFDFDAFADASGNVMTISSVE
jgi:hypothetical protein